KADIAVVVRVNGAIRADHVEDPFAAGAKVDALRPAGEPVGPPPSRQRGGVAPGRPDPGDGGGDHALQHHGAVVNLHGHVINPLAYSSSCVTTVPQPS